MSISKGLEFCWTRVGFSPNPQILDTSIFVPTVGLAQYSYILLNVASHHVLCRATSIQCTFDQPILITMRSQPFWVTHRSLLFFNEVT